MSAREVGEHPCVAGFSFCQRRSASRNFVILGEISSSDGENVVQWQAAGEVSVGLLEMFVGYSCIVVPKGNFASGANSLRDSTKIIFAGVRQSGDKIVVLIQARAGASLGKSKPYPSHRRGRSQ